MAHFIYEYSANLPEDLLDLQGLMQKMHRSTRRWHPRLCTEYLARLMVITAVRTWVKGGLGCG